MLDKRKIIFMGTSEFSKTILEKLFQVHEIECVVTNNDKTIGRKNKIIFSPVKQFCIENNIKYIQVSKFRNEVDKLENLNSKLVITASFGHIIPKEFLDKYHVVNVHASILPKYRGPNPIAWSILDNMKKCGISIMKTEYKLDSGPVYLSKKISIEIEDTKSTLEEKLSILGAQLLLKYLDNMENIKGVEQDENKVKKAPIFDKSMQFIDFSKKSIKVYNQIRSLQDEPGAFVYCKNILLKLVKTKISDIILNEKPGFAKVLNKQILIATKDLAIEVLQLQLEGKKILSSKEFLNGNNLDNVILRREKL